jgi:hypothetical protein
MNENATETTPGRTWYDAYIAAHPYLGGDGMCLPYDDLADEHSAAVEAGAQAVLKGGYPNVTQQLAERDQLERERDQLAEGGRALGRVVELQLSTLMAAWIDAERGDLDAAKETIAQWIENVPELEEWNGTETGAEWLKRTEEAESPATPE